MVELADTLDLGSSGQPCRFKSCYPHHVRRTQLYSVSAASFFLFQIGPASLGSDLDPGTN